HPRALHSFPTRRSSDLLRRVRDPETDDLESRQAGDVASVEEDMPAGRLWPAADRHQQSRFAGAVGADQRDDLASGDFEVDAFQRSEEHTSELQSPYDLV